ncbi:MAG TPA: phosphoglycerate dehydrogenase [Termitinemataceae bacterium]|nr:phosphoglycerate dehydrogenase [Termitinemataceae bacterium]HOM22278.1 phosphoglycerate dehydrogenase [Termitinemataceae bacterium]HPP99300.1 phosphoglycerate dehydrogenase [Termitinemataceae bacterium]
MFRILTANKISPRGLELFPRDMYEIASEIPNPDAILVRSADLHSVEIPSSVKAIARAGAGVNNIPVDLCSERGIVVFNTPGANANAVKELAIAGLLLSSRKIVEGIAWGKTLIEKGDEVPDLVEKGKSQFEGPEIKGKTLGVIGLGAIGVMVANDAVNLGMDVIGYDPYISVDAAWNLSREVKKAETLEGLLRVADYITLHVPLMDATKGMIDMEKIRLMKKGVRLINLARGGLVNDADLIQALQEGKISCYVTDFPNAELLKQERVLCIPHLGASTPEAEENCAEMAVLQLRDYLEAGNIKNSVNFPHCKLEQRSPYRLLVANRNVPNMVGQITTILAEGNINITDLINHHKDKYAYNIIDTESPIPDHLIQKIQAVEGIIRVRVIEKK